VRGVSRASKDDSQNCKISAVALRGSLRSHLRVTDLTIMARQKAQSAVFAPEVPAIPVILAVIYHFTS
jgi:hypothetical protein